MSTHGKSWRAGFTLLELLTVIVIMFVVMGIAVGSFVGYTRGAALRGSVMNVKGTLQLARQHAVTYQRATAVVFDSSGDDHTYIPVVETALCSGLGAGGRRLDLVYPLQIEDDALGGQFVYNMRTGARSRVVEHRENWIRIENAVFSVGDRVGISIHSRRVLPEGIHFRSHPPIVFFYSDGTSNEDNQIELAEIGYDDLPPRVLQVRGLTGWVSEES